MPLGVTREDKWIFHAAASPKLSPVFAVCAALQSMPVALLVNQAITLDIGAQGAASRVNPHLESGVSGNPKGKTPGSGQLQKLRASIANDVPDILSGLVTAAKAGDMQAARLILERVLPPIKAIEQAVALQLPEGGTLPPSNRLHLYGNDLVISNLLLDSGLSQNIINQVARHDRDSNRESVAADRAVPHLMAALAMAHKGATVSQQDAAQLRVKAAAHALHGDARSSILYMAKLNAAVGVKGNTIAKCNLGRNFPKTGSDGLVAWSLGRYVKRIARRNPHTTFNVKDDVYHKGFAVEVGVDNIIHARSLHPFTALSFTCNSLTTPTADLPLP